MGHQGCGEIGPAQCYATVAIGVAVLSAGPAAVDIPPGQAPKEVWICPRTPIVLLWESSNADNVDIQPDLGLQPPSGYQVIPDLASPNTDLHRPITNNKVYTADTKGGGCVAAHDQVSVNVVEDGDEIPQSATYNREFGYWVANLPDHTYDRNIQVEAVIIDTGKPDSITHPSWRHDHIYAGEPPVGTVIPSTNTWTSTSSTFSLPGEHRFTPEPPGTALSSGEQQRVLYFRLRVKCSL
jgi:hypothetical protein